MEGTKIMTTWKPKKWLAILLGFFVPSLGMLYIVRVRLAAAYFLAGIVAGSLDLWIVFSQAPWGRYLFFGWTLMAIGAVHSYWLVRQNRVIPIRPWYSRWYSLLALPIVLTVMIFSFRAFLFEPFRMPSGSMLPSINPGDIPVVSKWGYGHYATFGITLARSGLAKEILISKMLQPSEAKPLGEAQRRWRQRSGAWEACRAGTDG
jgi:signal peptidase I